MKQYRVWKLVYFEETEEVQSATYRERPLKAGSRRKKVELIEGVNPTWRDLYSEFIGERKR